MKNTNNYKKDLGRIGEEIAIKDLYSKGYEILEKNYHAGKNAEIDIICQFQNSIRFIEVKTRTNTENGNPEESITSFKFSKIKFAATTWLLRKNYNLYDTNFGFDFYGILLNRNMEIISKNFKIDFFR